MGRPLAKFRLLSSEEKKERKKAQWGNLLQNLGCYFQLVKLIPLQPNKPKKESSVGEPLEKSGCSLQLVELIPL